MKKTSYMQPETEYVPIMTEQILYTTSVEEGEPDEGEPEAKKTTFDEDWEEENEKDDLNWFSTPIRSKNVWER